MKTLLTSELLPDSKLLTLCWGRKNRLLLITTLLFVFTTLHYAQNINNITYPFPYDELYFENDFTQSTDSNLTLISQLGIGPCYDAVTVGNYTYLGNGALFQVLDVSDPFNLVLVGEVLIPSGNIWDIEIRGDYAFTTSPFMVIDISDPYNPSIISSLTTAGSKLKLEGDYVYIGYFYGIYIVDISNPLQPQEVSWMLTSGELVTGIAVKDTYLYATTYDGMVIDIFDISDKNNPILISQYAVGALGGDLCIKDNYLFAGFFDFSVYDISDPTQLVYLNKIPEHARATGITFIDTLVYISLGGSIPYGGISIVSISHLNNLYEIARFKSINSPIEYVRCEIKNNYAYLSSGIGLDIFNIENPSSPEYINSYLTGYEFDKMKLQNGLLFTTGHYSGFKIIDYTDPEKLKVIGQYQEKTVVKDFDASDSYAYLLADHSIIILNIENPLSPYKINEITIPDSLFTGGAILLKDSLLIASFPTSYLTIINVSDPLNPYILDSISTGEVRNLAISDNYLYSAEGFDGMKIYKLETPPFLVNTIDSVTFALLIEDHFLFTCLEGFSIYDISDPFALIVLGNISLPGSISGMEISKSDNYVSLAYYYNLEVIDVSDPYNSFIAAFSRDERYTSVASISNLIFVGNQHRGIKVFRNDLITSVKNNSSTKISQISLFQNYPNPFNPSTTIKFEIPKGGLVTLKIYNILGEEIETLVNEEKSSGRYEVNFDASKLASGVFIYQLIVNDPSAGSGQSYVNVKKMIFIK